MTQNEIDELRQVVQLRIDFLLVLIDENSRSEELSTPPLEVDNMFERAPSRVEKTIIVEAERELTQLTRTLSWLDSDHAGKCIACQSDIDFEQIKKTPGSRQCEVCSNIISGEK